MAGEAGTFLEARRLRAIALSHRSPLYSDRAIHAPATVSTDLIRDRRGRSSEGAGELRERLAGMQSYPDLLALFYRQRRASRARASTGCCFGVTRPSWPVRCNDRWNSPTITIAIRIGTYSLNSVSPPSVVESPQVVYEQVS